MPSAYALLITTIVAIGFSAAARAQPTIDSDQAANAATLDNAVPASPSESVAPIQPARFGQPVRLDPVALRDVLPGVSTASELESKWGAPLSDQARLGTGRGTYQFAPFQQIEVTLGQGKVMSIVAHLAQSISLEEAIEQFVPSAANPVEVLDNAGNALGLAFPERGVVFAYAPKTDHVAQMLFDPIDDESFLLRAERNQHRAPQQSLADLEFVLKKRGQSARALALTAQIFFEAGQLNDAVAQIDSALKVEPANPSYLLTRSEILAESGDFAAAEQTCQRVLKQQTLAAELKARALCLLGDFLANGPKRDFKRAIEQHMAAIQIAQPLATSQRAATRRAAKHVLVCAQLGAANDIAWGFWQQKDKAVPKWLAAAHEAAEDLIDHEQGDECLHLLVLRRALAASAGTEGKLDPVVWTKEAITTARRLIDASEDPWRRGRIDWELGLALYDALQADQARGFHDHALSNSSLVVNHLESALKQRQETPHSAYLLGRLYFRIGAIHAVELNDHRAAVVWFQKALPLLERPLPATAAADVGRLGESFVSMGISFWEANRRDEAIRLTNYGISLVAQGVKQHVIGEDALAVPYSNLAFMHRELGNANQAESFAALAARADVARRQ